MAEKDVICLSVSTKRTVFLCQCRGLCVIVAAVNKHAIFTLANHGFDTSNGENAVGGRCSAYIFPALQTFRLTFLRMRDICKIINVQRKEKGINTTGCMLGCI